MRRDSCEVRQLLASHRWLFRHQPILHVCGNAELSSFSDGFGSLQSGRQLFGLCQSFRCPGSPIVTIDIVARQFCHVIVPTVARRSLCSRPITSDFIGSAFTCASWMRPHFVHRRVQCSNPERAEVIRWISMRDWHLGQRGRSATRGDRLDVCGSGNRLPPVNQAGALPSWLRWLAERCGDRSSMPTRRYYR